MALSTHVQRAIFLVRRQVRSIGVAPLRQARQLIDAAAPWFRPDAVEASASMAAGVSDDPQGTRMKLAHAILWVATDDRRDVNALPQAALYAMAP